MLICIKLLTKNKVNIFVMGLYSKNINSNFFQLIHNFFIKFLIFMTDNVLFLGEGEMKKAEMFHINSNKLKYVGFAIDTNFGKIQIYFQNSIETIFYLLEMIKIEISNFY